MAAAPSDAMKRMPVGEPGWVARRRTCDCPPCAACPCRRELPAGVRRAHVVGVGGLLVVALVVVLLGRDPAPPPGLLFDGLVASGCQLDRPSSSTGHRSIVFGLATVAQKKNDKFDPRGKGAVTKIPWDAPPAQIPPKARYC